MDKLIHRRKGRVLCVYEICCFIARLIMSMRLCSYINFIHSLPLSLSLSLTHTHTHTHTHSIAVDQRHLSGQDVKCQITLCLALAPPLPPNLHPTHQVHWNGEWPRPVDVPLSVELHPLLPPVRVRLT